MFLLFFLQEIYLIKKNKESNENSLQKHEVHQHTETVVNENNDTILYLLEIKKGEECPVCQSIVD
jgi:hypothetical protein